MKGNPRFDPDPAVRVAAMLSERDTARMFDKLLAEQRLGTVTLKSLDGLALKRARWLWKGRLAQGRISLLAGREGAGKSTIAADLAAAVTVGKLPGGSFGTPRGVIIVATEDDFAVTIGPRLVAAGADMARVFVVESTESTELSLPGDLPAVELQAAERDVALMILDPMISRLGSLDTHRDADVRQALEPLAASAERSGMAVLGLIHLNKTATTDPTRAIMGSVAFAAVARSVLMAGYDPDDDTRANRLLSHPKNNLGPLAPTLAYTIVELTVGEDEGDITASKVKWGLEDGRSAFDIMTATSGESKAQGKRKSAISWLEDYLEQHGACEAGKVKLRGATELGVSERTIKRAADELGVVVERTGFAGTVTWALPG